MKNAFMIAATGSGCGKTTITCALLKAIKNRGLVPKAYKCGPDYIDPMFHKSVLGIESQNLDLFFSDKNEIRDLFYGDDGSDVSVVEGVMGLYDGISSSGNEGSSYDLACKLDIPVILVVNAHGMGRSLLAVIRGFLSMDEERRIKAVILNQISPMFYSTICKQIEEELGIDVLGYFPTMKDINLESRYLGLKMPSEIDNLEKDVLKGAEVISQRIDFEKLFRISKVNCNIIEKQRDNGVSGYRISFDPNGQHGEKVRIAVARDEAFCFFYEENLKLLKKLGAEIVEFSPIADSKLPEGVDGLLLGGGYPELHAKKLSSNVGMRNSIKTAIESGIPSLAECGGFMYLHDSIRVDDTEYPMAGVISGNCEKKEKLVRFGYLLIKEKENNFILGENRTIKGHEFHYYDSSNNGKDALSSKPEGNRNWDAAHISDNYWWGFAHLYYPSNVKFAEAFIDKCRKWRKNNG